MRQIIAIAIGGASGALLRYWTSMGIHDALGREFPYGTLTVNVSGSLLAGLLTMVLLERFEVAAEWRMGLIVGVLGAFTTFSAFSVETVDLLNAGAVSKALLNIVLNVLLCLVATWFGMLLGRQL